MDWMLCPARIAAHGCAEIPGRLCRAEGCRRRIILYEAIRRVKLGRQAFGVAQSPESLDLSRSMEDKRLWSIVLIVGLPVKRGI